MEQQENTSYMTRAEAAQLLGVHVRTVDLYAKQGRIQPYRKGFYVRFKKEDVERLYKDLETIKIVEVKI
jgi:excisionase family DNA binding protein